MGEIVRLQKYIAMCGVASRRNAEVMISEGKVSVNDKKITELGSKVEIGCDRVKVSGEEIHIINKKYYILLNKPVGYVTTVSDQFNRPTVIDLIKNDIKARVVPVGRLDFDTEGLLLLTNDGDFTYRVTHPKFELGKTYIATLSDGISAKGLAQLRRGVEIDDFKTSPAEVEMINLDSRQTFIKITIHEGKNRQVRKMFEAVGAHVAHLQRIQIGKVALGNVPTGRWRYLTSHEVNYLMNS